MLIVAQPPFTERIACAECGVILKPSVVPSSCPWAVAGEINTLEILKEEFKTEGKSLNGQLLPFLPPGPP